MTAPGRVTLLRHASALGAMQLLSSLLAFALSIALARALGETQFGLFTFALASVSTLGAFGTVGTERLVLRDVPVHFAGRDWPALKGMIRWATLTAFVASAGIAIPVAMFMGIPAALLVPLTALGLLQASVLRGLLRPAMSEFLRGALPRVIVLALIVVVGRNLGRPASAADALALTALAAFVALAGGWLVVRHAMLPAARDATAEIRSREWSAAAVRFFLLSTLVAVSASADVIGLGLLGTPEAVGGYGAALRLAAIAPLAFNTVNSAMAPTIAALFAAGRTDELRALASRMTRWTLAFAVLVMMAIAPIARYALGAFGDGFGSAAGPLLVLLGAQVANVAAGPVATLLTMAGHERDALWAMAGSTTVNILLCAVLIPGYGAVGAAGASLAGTVVWNGAMLWRVQRRFGFLPLSG